MGILFWAYEPSFRKCKFLVKWLFSSVYSDLLVLQEVDAKKIGDRIQVGTPATIPANEVTTSTEPIIASNHPTAPEAPINV